MMIKGDNHNADQHVLTIGDVYVSISESGCLRIDASRKGNWKAYGCFICGDELHRKLLLSELYVYEREVARQSAHLS